MIAEVTGEAIAQADADAVNHMRLSEDLHLDSLGRVQLQSALEQRFGVELEDDAVANLEDVAELRALVEQQLEPDVSRQAGPASTSASRRSTDNSGDSAGCEFRVQLSALAVELGDAGWAGGVYRARDAACGVAAGGAARGPRGGGAPRRRRCW